MIDALKPAFTLFQFKDGGMFKNLGGQAVIESPETNRETFGISFS
jgi:hypothetical protein